MKFLKKPAVAAILSIILIVSISLAAVHVKMQQMCSEVIYGFYDGVYYNGELQDSIESHLRNIIDYSEDIKDLADARGLNTDDLYFAVDSLELGFVYSENDVNYLYFCYEDMMDQLKSLRTALINSELNDDEAAKIDVLYDEIALQEELIKTSGYNESVKEWRRENNSELFGFFANITGVTLPRAFSRG